MAVRHRPQPAAPVPQAQPDRDGGAGPARPAGRLARARTTTTRVDERVAAAPAAPGLRDAVGALPDDQRAALELRVVQQLPYEEVAGRLDCSINAARLRVSRALRALTAELKGAGRETPAPAELIALGDQLEAAAQRALGRRRARRQVVLNAAASLIVAVPLTLSVAGSSLVGSAAPVTTPTPTPQRDRHHRRHRRPSGRVTTDDFPPREIARMRAAPTPEMLLLPTTVPRPALR